LKAPILVAICGPTGSGKTEIAIELAERFQTEIINFDSIQIFKDLDIGSNKPTSFQLARVQHHLISKINPDSDFSAGDFRNQARELINEKLKNKNVIILVGGTGFYLQALIKGMYDIPKIPSNIKERLKLELKESGKDHLYERLNSIDSSYAAQISSQDTYRVLRGLEIFEGTGKTPSEIRNLFKAQPPEFNVIQIGLNLKKEALKARILLRTEKMLKSGLVDEVKNLIEKYGADIKPLSSVGYREVKDFLIMALDENQLASKINESTVKLVKRQLTWFSRDCRVWFDSEKSLVELRDEIYTFLKPIVPS
jgi:tRNA dimethylallyltransferase